MTSANFDILGTSYEVILTSEEEEQCLVDCGAVTKIYRHQILIDMTDGRKSLDNHEYAVQWRTTARHEIIHAYLTESGLLFNSLSVEAWAMNEEMVDWFALQWDKINKTIKAVIKFIENSEESKYDDKVA